MRIFAISDLHTDFKRNWSIVERFPSRDYREDALIVAGDVADNLEVIEKTLASLRAKFDRVFYTPGNHELWVRDQLYDSIEKFHLILELCDRLGIETGPGRVEGIWVVPLFSWYDPDFALIEERAEARTKGWADFQFCRWPDGRVGAICEHFLKMNEARLIEYDAPVVSFSHFLPRRDLLPPLEYLRFKGLPKVAGCSGLEDQIREVGSIAHVFGHSHINVDRVVDGVRYVQNALSYPKEKKAATLPGKLIHPCSSPGVAQR